MPFQAPAAPQNEAPGRSGGARGRHDHVFAALDLGTNNCRLLVARPKADGFEVIDAFSHIVRLGEGVGESGVLSKGAMARTIAALRVCANKIERRGVTRLRGVATEACRRASNCIEFVDRAAAETGISLDIITPREEILLALAGCAPLLDVSRPDALLFDIGGGSTEIIWLGLAPGQQPEIRALISLPCGVVTFAERYGGRDVSPEVYDAMVTEVEDLLRPFENEHRLAPRIRAGTSQMLGTSGTVTTLAAVHLGMPRYDRRRVDGSWLMIEDIARATGQLATMDYEARARHPCIRRGRADLVIAGCAILEAITRTWPAKRLRVADRGLREGMLLALMGEADLEAAAHSGEHP